jgi:transposase
MLQKERRMSEVEVLARVERRRRWTPAEKAALLAEVEAEGGKIRVVARRHGISESLLYNWRSAKKAAVEAGAGSSGPITFLPIGVIGDPANEPRAMVPSLERPRSARRAAEVRAGAIEITLPDGSRVCVDTLVNEEALLRVIRAVRGSR